jgi:hypothetical protein
MTTARKRIHVQPQTTVDELLAEAREQPVVLERDGELYQLSKTAPDDIWVGYDPDTVRAALERAVGMLDGVDRKVLIRDLRVERGQDSPGHPA